MLVHNQQAEERGVTSTQTSLHKQSQNPTDIVNTCPHQLDLHSLNSQNTMLQTLPFNSRSIDLEENTFIVIQQQLQELQHRFNGIHKILIDHSQFQSNLHEGKKGYKTAPIDPSTLNSDFTNKINIISDINSLVAEIERSNTVDQLQSGDILETKFQQYYLERHYGTLTCNFDSLQIQENSKCNSSEQEGSLTKQEEKCIISKIGNYQSLIPQSKITYSQQFCQTHQIDYQITVSVPKIIEVEVPILVYKVKDMILRCEESDLCGNMDDIINKYSMPYEDIYSQASEKQLPKQIASANPQTVPQPTEVQLAYSDFPEEDNLKLPLDSYAQIQSLISNSDRPDTERSKSYLEHDPQLETEAVFITEKVVSRSIIQKFEESQRMLMEQNIQLKQYVAVLEAQLSQNKKENNYLQSQNTKLSRRLQEQIQQTEYFSQKLQDLNTELLEEKVLSLTHLSESKQRKIQMLTHQISQQSQKLHLFTSQIEDLELNHQRTLDLLEQKEEELMSMCKLLEEKENQVTELTSCQDEVIQFASSTEITLKEEIDKLEREKSQLKQNLKFCEQRLQNEGISLHIEQANQIKGYIEQRQHNFTLQLQQVNKKYDQILASYQQQLTDLKTQLQQLRNQEQWKSKALEQHKEREFQLKQKQKEARRQQKDNYKQFEVIIEDYNKQLQDKDEEIIRLKMKMGEAPDTKTDLQVQIIIQRSYHTIAVLQHQLRVERAHKTQLSSQLIHLDQLIQSHLQTSPSKQDHDSLLLEQMSLELERKMSENSNLKEQLQSQSLSSTQMSEGDRSEIYSVREENKKLKRLNQKMKRYSCALEEEIKAICLVQQCQSHRSWIDKMTEQRDYYMTLATQQTTC